MQLLNLVQSKTKTKPLFYQTIHKQVHIVFFTCRPIYWCFLGGWKDQKTNRLVYSHVHLC